MNKVTIQEREICFELDKTDFTAEVINSPYARGYLYISHSIEYQSQQYRITKIKEGSFKNNSTINSVRFHNDSVLSSIQKKAFSFSKIKNIFIPASVVELEDGWCKSTYNLTNVSISPENPNFKYLDKDQKIIVGKSDKKSEIFDTVIFACRDIKQATIPKQIKYIKSYAFENCYKINSIEFSEDSKIQFFGKKFIAFSMVNNIFIPDHVKELEDGWCSDIWNLTNVIISPKNKNFKFLDEEHKIIVGKSDKNSEVFDTIIFACRDIKQITIPKQTKSIKSHAFENCNFLKSIEISKDSEIRTFCKLSFRSVPIKSLYIPHCFDEFQDNWCGNNTKLKNIEISPENKNFKFLDEEHKIIIGKSDIKTEIFDTIIFACRDIKEATIPKEIKYIQKNAFEDCNLLKSVKFSSDSHLISIGKNAFSFSSIKEITIPKSVTQIQKYAFNNCDELEKVVFEEGSNLTSFSECVFNSCYNLRMIEVPKKMKLRSIEGHFINNTQIKELFIHSTVENIDENWCYNIKNLSKVIISPENKNFKYLDEDHKIIVEKSDKNSEVFDTIIFASRDIKEATIPEQIKYIKPHSFENCQQLKTINFSKDSKITFFMASTFSLSSIQNLTIPASLEEIDEGWCDGSLGLISVKISPGNKNFKFLDEEHKIIVEKSDKNSEIFDKIIFACRDIKQAIIPKQIKYIQKSAFGNCNQLQVVEFSKDSELLFIGESAFASSSFVKFTLPKSVTIIEKYAFNLCINLERFIIENDSKLLTLSYRLFSCNSNLKIIEIPEKSSLKKIENETFSYSSIEKIFIPATVEELEDNWCKNASNLKVVTISPENKNFKYFEKNDKIIVGKSDINSEIFDTIIFVRRDIEEAIIPNQIKYIKPELFHRCKKLKSFEISEGSEISTIFENSFYCSYVRKITIPSSIDEFEDEWCTDTPKLKNVIISPKNKNFKYLDEEHKIIVGKSDKYSDIFDMIIFVSRDIKKAIIPKQIKYIKPNSFENCKKLKKIKFSKDSELLSIGIYSFASSSVRQIKIPKSVSKIKSYAFFYCQKLELVEFEEGSKIKSFNTDLFYNCIMLKKVKITDNSSLHRICKGAFYNTNIESLFIPATVDDIEDNWCEKVCYLNEIEISPKNKNFKFLDEEHKIIVGKSDKNSEIFDTIIFACRDIKEATIPKEIKYIKPRVFEDCDELKTVNFSDDSEIRTFKSKTFSSKSIENILNIPSTVEELDEDWCGNPNNLTNVIISPKNKNFKYLDKEHKIIVGKSNKKSEIFDTIIFASRNIKQATIPKQIKFIQKNAFKNCKLLKKLEIPDDSEIISIGGRAFANTSIVSFRSPKQIYKYEGSFLYSCKDLLCLEFLGNSFLKCGYGSIFSDCANMIIISFPNIQRLEISMGDFPIFIPDKFRIYICAGKEVLISPKKKSNYDFNDFENSESSSSFSTSDSDYFDN